jgi:branched-chain amino acid transport system ATP-binding protein
MIKLLEMRDVSRRFGGLLAVNNVTLSVEQGRVLGLIGPNGAGKTTLVNLISGHVRLTAGELRFKGSRIDGLPPHRIARLGIARTFQIVQPFPEMTVLENVTAAALFAGGIANQSEAKDFARAQLARVGLGGQEKMAASRLPLGLRKRLEFAKSLAMKPSILLLDEVNAGLHGGELGEAIQLIRGLSRDGLTIVVIEHLMKVVVSLCDEIAVLHHGELIAKGPTRTVMNDPQVVEAYLGERYLKKRPRGELRI